MDLTANLKMKTPRVSLRPAAPAGHSSNVNGAVDGQELDQ